MSEFRRKSGRNKGHRRIWIEGARLVACGLEPGTAMYRSMHDDGRMTLSPTCQPSYARKHSIAGSVDRPIIDLCGAWVTQFMAGLSHFSVVVAVNGNDVELLISPAKGESEYE